MKLPIRRNGDYYMSDTGTSDENVRPLGKCDRIRMRYLGKHRSLLVNYLQ